MVEVKNEGKSPRGVHDKKGRHVLIYPGQTKPVDLNAAGIKGIERKRYLVIVNGLTEQEDSNPLDALISDAESLGIAVDKRWGEKRLRAEIDKALEDAVHTPDSE